ncbi:MULTISPECIES: hypothetical protein [Pseudomonas]|uniref:LasR-specific antiactivator QslA domain-containing protein n=1 Tax=Pseudomonas oryzihabitans TaxID=47885 RepID=A0ABX3IVU1_9PSED|nr:MULTISPECIES: hypothetical protein [Pseudomonas]ONN71149.1 hypothetical protein BVL52_11660 [Pseudomonas psychrotolerans]
MTFSPEQHTLFLLAVIAQAKRLHADSVDGPVVGWSELDDLQQQAWAWSACQSLGHPLQRWRAAISATRQPGQTVKHLLSMLDGPGAEELQAVQRAG